MIQADATLDYRIPRIFHCCNTDYANRRRLDWRACTDVTDYGDTADANGEREENG